MYYAILPTANNYSILQLKTVHNILCTRLQHLYPYAKSGNLAKLSL